LTETTALLGFVWQFFSSNREATNQSVLGFFQEKRSKPRLGFGPKNYYLISKLRGSDYRSLIDVEISSSLLFFRSACRRSRLSVSRQSLRSRWAS
jgi:hypothetical protein